jgi:hypothetical protein
VGPLDRLGNNTWQGETHIEGSRRRGNYSKKNDGARTLRVPYYSLTTIKRPAADLVECFVHIGMQTSNSG